MECRFFAMGMEDSMSFRRAYPVVGRLLVIALLVVVGPACGKKKTDPAPHILQGLPLPDATGVPYFPLMLLEFDKEIDDTTVNITNIQIWTTDGSGNPTAAWGGGWTFYHIKNSFQIVIENTSAFAASTQYAVLIFNGLKSSAGDAISGGIALRFTVTNVANNNQPAFSAPVQDGTKGTAGQIVWTWTQATEGTPITATYDFYMSTTTLDEDLFANPPFFSSSMTSGDTMSGGLMSGTTYFFVLICHDSAGNIRLIQEFTGTAK
jgi:hypothetical protein